MYNLYRVGQKTGLCWRVDNFVTVSGKVCDMPKYSKFCVEKCTKLGHYETWTSGKLSILCISHAFLPLTVEKLSTFKTIRFLARLYMNTAFLPRDAMHPR